MRTVKLIEIPLSLMAVWSAISGNTAMMLISVFLYGTAATFFSPAKYSLIQDNAGKENLLKANAAVSASTYVSILLGLVIGSLASDETLRLRALLVLPAVSLISAAASFLVRSGSGTESVRVHANFIRTLLPASHSAGGTDGSSSPYSAAPGSGSSRRCSPSCSRPRLP